MIKQSGGASTKVKGWGSDESNLKHQNMPLRDLHLGGHDLNHSYKNPPASISPDVKSAGTNHSYSHPLVRPGKENAPNSQTRASRVFPVNQTGRNKV